MFRRGFVGWIGVYNDSLVRRDELFLDFSILDSRGDEINPNLPGLGLIPPNICKRCRNYYPFGTREWREYPDNVCSELKERLKREAGISSA